MPPFQLKDVARNGNCYYLCIYHIAKENQQIKDTLLLFEDNENDCSHEIRHYVSMSLKRERKSKSILQRLLEIYESVTEPNDLQELYPILKDLPKNLQFTEACNQILEKIRDTKVFASQVEHEIIASKLLPLSLHLIILSKENSEDKSEIATRWVNELHILLPKIKTKNVAILINEDNLHYKYLMYDRKAIMNKNELQDVIEKAVNDENSTPKKKLCRSNVA